MAIPTNGIRMMELRDVKIFKLLTDTSGAPTYSASVDITGSLKLSVAPKTEVKKLYGDSKLLDIYQRITEVELDIEASLMSLDAMQIIMGGTLSTTASTVTYQLKGADLYPPYFKIEGQWTYAGDGIGDAHVILYKCKTTDAPNLELNDSSGNFGTVKFKAVALPAVSNDLWFDILLNNVAVPIA